MSFFENLSWVFSACSVLNRFFDTFRMFCMRASFQKKSQKGFSFVEVIISLFVLSIGFVGVVNLATTTLRNSFLQRDAVIASMLVQEGAELVYNVRDTNIAQGHASFAGMSGGSYRISSANPTLGSGSYQLSMDTNGIYGYSGSNQTKFSRKIIVEETLTGSVQKRKITSVVIWGGSTFPTTIDTAHCAKSIPNPPGPPMHCSFAQTELQEN